MHLFKRLAVAVTAAGLLLGAAAGTASASAAGPKPATAAPAVRLAGGQTAVTTAPGLAGVLLKNDIVPIALLPGISGAGSGRGGVFVRFTFPVTGGSVNLAKLTGTIDHEGGILFLNPATGKQIAVSDFTINLGKHVLTAIVNGNPKMRVPLLNLNLSHAKLKAGKHFVSVRNIAVSLTKTAAGALNATFGTSLFKGGLKFGTASTHIFF